MKDLARQLLTVIDEAKTPREAIAKTIVLFAFVVSAGVLVPVVVAMVVLWNQQERISERLLTFMLERPNLQQRLTEEDIDRLLEIQERTGALAIGVAEFDRPETPAELQADLDAVEREIGAELNAKTEAELETQLIWSEPPDALRLMGNPHPEKSSLTATGLQVILAGVQPVRSPSHPPCENGSGKPYQVRYAISSFGLTDGYLFAAFDRQPDRQLTCTLLSHVAKNL